jgi:hypothetical protein
VTDDRTNQICPRCRTASPPDVTVCRVCGQPLVPTRPFQAFTHEPVSRPAPRRRLTTPQRRSLALGMVTVAAICVVVVVALLAITAPLHSGTVGAAMPTTGPFTATPTPTFTPTPSPTPTPVPMVRVTIKLIEVFCNTKENAFTPDELYLMTTFSDPDKELSADAYTQSHLTQPLAISGGQGLPFPLSPLTIFDEVLPQHSQIKGGLTAYNDTNGLDWGRIQTWSADIAESVGNGLIEDGITSDNWPTVAAGVVLNLAVVAWYGLAGLSDDTAHQLGKEALTLSSDGPPSEDRTFHFAHQGSVLGIGSWDYTVNYQITRSFVTG